MASVSGVVVSRGPAAAASPLIFGKSTWAGFSLVESLFLMFSIFSCILLAGRLTGDAPYVTTIAVDTLQLSSW